MRLIVRGRFMFFRCHLAGKPVVASAHEFKGHNYRRLIYFLNFCFSTLLKRGDCFLFCFFFFYLALEFKSLLTVRLTRIEILTTKKTEIKCARFKWFIPFVNNNIMKIRMKITCKTIFLPVVFCFILLFAGVVWQVSLNRWWRNLNRAGGLNENISRGK